MSILLTAAAKKKFMKKIKEKRSQDASGACASGPPGSTEQTTVWYWLLDGVETTVMYSRDSSEIWCNGSTINIQSMHDPSLGHVYDFIITLPEVQSCHEAKLLRMDDGRYMLYVDGYVINEYYK